MCRKYKYDVAFSFATQDLRVAQQIEEILTRMKIRCYIYTKEDQWGEILIEKLLRVYTRESKFVLLIASRNYEKNYWPGIEKQFVHGIRGRGSDVLTLRLDDWNMKGKSIDSFTVFEKWNDNPAEIADKIAKRVQVWRNKRKRRCLGIAVALLLVLSCCGYWFWKNADSSTSRQSIGIEHVAKGIIGNDVKPPGEPPIPPPVRILLYGNVRDVLTKKPIDGATISVAGKQAITKNGSYSISFSPTQKGSMVLEYNVDKNGYESATFSETIVVDRLKEYTKNIFLTKSSQ